ncbi:MAG: hypothetical protein NC517_02480 [Firmicutes bacterium]|nr:hypothetical protein [Bacillota bacterium]
MLLLGVLYDKVLYKCNRNVLLGIACILVLAIGIYWVSVCGAAPCADQKMICYYANALNDGDFSGIWKGCYLARYSHLLGITTLLRGFFMIFGRENYMAFQYFNALMLPLIVFSGCQILRRISGNNEKTAGRVETYYLFLTVTCFPMYAYTSFVYGEISSTAMTLLAAWLLLSCLEKPTVAKAAGLALASGAAVQFRRNTLIVLIAFGIVILIRLICSFDRKLLIAGGSILAGVLVLQFAVRLPYLSVWDKEARSIPAILWIAMGMHDTEGGPGWWDGYNYIIFAESGDDVKAATETAYADIRNSLKKFKDDPEYCRYFWKTKINIQWQVPMYQCIAMTNNIEREQSRLVQMIYREETLGKIIKNYMKAFQLFMYGCILFWLLKNLKKEIPIEKYVLLIAVFGSFLFSIIWEAKTRYVFPCLILMIPYFAIGLHELTEGVANKAKSLRASEAANR